MTREFQQMLQLAAIGATGHSIGVDCTNIDWGKVIAVAKKHKVEYFVAYALKCNPQISCPSEIRDPLLKEARTIMFANAVHKHAIFQLIKDMEAAGIHAVLLKGYAISDCYALAESRISGDVDIWIDVKVEKRAYEFMKQQGFSVEPRWKNSHHAVCCHPQLGHIELHVSLYGGMAEAVWFSRTEDLINIQEKHAYIESEDGGYYSLGYTDHFVFIVLHMIKHFIARGLTVQMLLDVALYFKRYADRIDVSRAWGVFGNLRYDELLNCILLVMIQYCGFDRKDFAGIEIHDSKRVSLVLEDLEEGGWMGCTSNTLREDGKHEYSRQIIMTNRSKVQYIWYMFRWKSREYMRLVFPTKDALAMKYSFVCNHTWLIPYAWLHRLIYRGIKALKNGALTSDIVINEQKISELSKDRIRMFRELNMLD